MIDQSRLSFWIEQNLNVLLEGRHGVGKTSVIFEELDRRGIKYAYFSGATMDPWVDFVGVPRPVQDSQGSYLELVIPKQFRDEDIELIFMDEFNRSHAKVRNACMELIQFKSINGRKFPKLRMVWAAINPYDGSGEYDTEGLDPAQLDRFHVQYSIPFDINETYLSKKYGFETAAIASEWWNNIPEDIRHKVSPRRLDYALEVFSCGGVSYLRDILPQSTNVSDLERSLERKGKVLSDRIMEAFEKKDAKSLSNILNNPVFWAAGEKFVENSKSSVPELMEFAVPLLSVERIISFIASDQNPNIVRYAFKNDLIKAKDCKFNEFMTKKVEGWLRDVFEEKQAEISNPEVPEPSPEELAARESSKKKESPKKESEFFEVEKTEDDEYEDFYNEKIDSSKLSDLISKVENAGGAAKLKNNNMAKLYARLERDMPEELSKSLATRTIIVLDQMLKSRSGREFPNILQMVNNCLYNLQGEKILRSSMQNILGYACTPSGRKSCELRPVK